MNTRLLKKSWAGILVVLFFFAGPSLAWGQRARIPGPNQGPWGEDVRGFMQISVGLTAMPILEMKTESPVALDEVESSFPGFSASIAFIPTWGNNGLSAGVSYDFSAGRFDQLVETDFESERGETTVAIADMAFRVGYLRFFGPGPWRPHLLTDIGLVWENIRTSTSYLGASDEIHDSTNVTGLVGAGLGFSKQTLNGLVGAELRVDAYPFTQRSELSTLGEKVDMDVHHPFIFKIMAIFALGRL